MTSLEHLTLNNAMTLPPIGLGVYQTPPDETRVTAARLRGEELRARVKLFDSKCPTHPDGDHNRRV